MTAPLEGIRILDFTRYLAGPFATTMLGDMGADVIKIEKPGEGDGTRQTDRVFEDGLSSYYLGLNRSKRSVAIDIAVRSGQDLVRRLSETADVVIENFRPSVMGKFGLSYEDLRTMNPALIYCSISSFGTTGPLRDKAGMDLIVQAMGGVMGLTGDPDGPPYRAGAPIADFVGAYQAVMGVTLALFARQRTGLGQKVDVALLDGQVSMLANYVPGFFVTGKPDRPVGVGHPQLVPYQLFPTLDGHLIVACLTEEFWRRLCRTLNLDNLIEDSRFRTNADRVEHRAELIPMIEKVTATYASSDLARALDAADVPSAPVHSMHDILNHPQLVENQMVIDLEQKRVGRYKAVGLPVKLRGTPGRVSRQAPELGEHTKEVLLEAGIEPELFGQLADQGVVSESPY
jgi:crotonobetainyl-CoA:carnitine CoA-transferase CaiB-like acyl-CoA transferase